MAFSGINLSAYGNKYANLLADVQSQIAHQGGAPGEVDSSGYNRQLTLKDGSPVNVHIGQNGTVENIASTQQGSWQSGTAPNQFSYSEGADGSIALRGMRAGDDYHQSGWKSFTDFAKGAAPIAALATGGALGLFDGLGAAGAGSGLLDPTLGGALDAQGFATNGLAQLGSGAAGTAPEVAGGLGVGEVGAAGAGATGLSGAGGSVAGETGAFDLGGVTGGVPGAGGNTGLGSTFGLGDPALGGTLAGTSGLPSWLNDLKDLVQGGSVINGLLHPNGKQTGTYTNTTASQMDPRMQNMLYGDGTAANTGILGRILSQGSIPQTAGTAQFGQGIDNYLGQDGLGSFVGSQQRAQALQGSNIGAPGMTAAQIAATPAMQAAQINAPGQNGMNLSGAYGKMIDGNAGANPYLTNALQSAVGLTNASYDRNATNLTNNLQRNILPGINDAAFAAGQYGSSRQGIAQGNAISDYTNQLSNSNLQLGLGNSANTTGQQAQSFNQGQDRSLSALNNLSGNQYSTAAGNAGFQQQANSTNYGGQLQTNMGNASLQQQANANNQQSQLDTNKLNSINQIAGVSASNGLLNQANTYGQANNSYGLDRAKSTAGGLGSFTGLNGTTTDSRPLYTNPAGNFASAATGLSGLLNTGSSLYNSGSSIFSGLSKLFG